MLNQQILVSLYTTVEYSAPGYLPLYAASAFPYDSKTKIHSFFSVTDPSNFKIIPIS